MRFEDLRLRLAGACMAVSCIAVPASAQPPSTISQTPVASAAVPPAEQPPGPVRRLSVDEAVRLALEQNLDIQVERLNPGIQDLSIASLRSLYALNLTSGLSFRQVERATASALEGASGVSTSADLQTRLGVDQLLPFGGGRLALSWQNARSSSNSVFSDFNPQLNGNLAASFTQPLVRNFGIDSTRQQLLVSRKNREISDVQLRTTVAATVRSVKNAYWSLLSSINFLRVQQQSLDLSRESLRNDRTRVEVGTAAPIDIIAAQAEVARNEEAVIIAEANIKSAEDSLRALIFDPSTPDFWTLRIEPTDAPVLEARPIDSDAAVANALKNRTDIIAARKNMEINDINIRYFRNQTLPDVNVQVNYNLAGVGGTQVERGEFVGLTPGPILSTSQRSFWAIQNDLLQNSFPDWTAGVAISYPLGRSSADANLARAKSQYQQSQLQIRQIELSIATQVREAARNVNTNLQRVTATRTAKDFAQQRLEAEQKKFTVGLSDSFRVFQAQRDLSVARNTELRAIIDYIRSVVDFESVQEVGGGSGITLAGR